MGNNAKIVLDHFTVSNAYKYWFDVAGGIVQNDNDPDEPGCATSMVTLYDTDTSSWIKSSPMVESRSYISATTYKNTIYVAGGEDQYNM